MPAPSEGYLRPVQPHRDLAAIADLVELCFHATLDLEGEKYLRQMRAAAQRARFMSSFVPLVDDTATFQISGFAWEIQGRLVGNLSLIPFKSAGRRCCLIANVAVHPDFRGRGIARALTEKALEHIRQQGYHAVWLQVREENLIALHLYQAAGFIERVRRTTWLFSPDGSGGAQPDGVEIGSRRGIHWSQQRGWLEHLYPVEYSWHLPVDWNAIRPDFRGMVYRFFTLYYPRHWAATRGGQLAGILTWLEVDHDSHLLLLAAPPECDQRAIKALLVHARRETPRQCRPSLNLPAGYATEALLAAGLYPQQTLIWMEYKFPT